MYKIKSNIEHYKISKDYVDYIKNCLDFEFFFKIHNNQIVTYDFANTKVFPQEINKEYC